MLFWVQESGDDPQNFENNFPKSKRFHMTLSPDLTQLKSIRKKEEIYWWTHFF